MQIDPTKSALQNLLALIDASNPSAPDEATEVTVSAPVPGSYPNNGDTQVTLTGAGLVNGVDYTGSVDVTYKRLALSAEAVSPSTAATVNSSITDPDAILALVATHYGFILSEISWVTDPTVPGTIPSTQSASVQCSGSLIYADGTATVSIDWEEPKTMMLLHFDGANNSTSFEDETGNTTAFTNNGAVISTDQSVFNGSSLFVNGSSDLLVTNNQFAGIGTGDFTLECWIWPINTSNGDIFCDTNNANGKIPRLRWVSASGFAIIDSSGANSVSVGSSWPKNAWSHIAAVRENGVETLYVNGVASAPLTNAGTYSGGVTAAIGRTGATANLFITAYIDEMRLSRVARYTANFTPPTEPFTLD